MITSEANIALSITPDTNGLYHPETEAQVIELVQYAIANGLQVRVRGASQSVDAAVYTDGYSEAGGQTKNINMVLNRMRQVFITPDSTLVRVQAGCNLGFDPFAPVDPGDPGATSTETNGLFYILQSNGLAIPNVTDAIHQTVAGFLSTGSSGGTTTHSFFDALVSVRIVDGEGNVKVFNRPVPDNPDDPFYAVGLSLGLLGIITEVTLQCIPSFNIIGQQAITPDAEAEYDFFGNGSPQKPSLQQYLSETEFARMIWWPFPTVKRVISWKAKTMDALDYKQTGTQPGAGFKPQPYKDAFDIEAIPGILKGLPKDLIEESSEAIVSIIYSAIGHWPQVLIDFLGEKITIGDKQYPTSLVQKLIELAFPQILPHLLNVFAPVDGNNPPQKFWDYWTGLANDTNEYSNNLLPAYRTEFWVPISQSQKVMAMLSEFYKDQFFKDSNDQNRNFANGCYVVEVLGGKQTSFWLSPSYSEDCVRINFYSLHQNDENVMDYFQQFWDLFYANKITFRMHWGYYLPPPASIEGKQYLPGQYPKMEAFAALRKQMDPHNIFLNTYWQQQLNL